ncbi:hypothetical protein [Rhodobacter sp. NSM]|uniref:hypothetical protein n=1 Tax=Rhodobacter sp. NSM TaxID=3457501 RepID=UPI003FCF82AE
MSTCAVHGSIADLRLIPIAGAKLVFYGDPQGWRRADGTMIPAGLVQVDAAADGTFVVPLVPGRYRVRYGFSAVEAVITVPEAEIAYLAQLIDLPPPPTLDAAQQAVLDAQSARDRANEAAAEADADRTAVAIDRGATEVAQAAAQVAASAAVDQAQDATAAADRAAARAAAALVSQGAAEDAAGAAAASASASAASSGQAATSADAASVSAGRAAASASAAAASEEAAATSAAVAQEARDGISMPLIQMAAVFADSQARYIEAHAFS